MSAAKYDLIVIGSGPAGQRAAVAASKMGKRVAVVEARSVVGGVCINTGTIPSKDHARGGAASLRLQLPLDLWRELPGEGKDHHGRPGLPGAGGDQDRSRCDRGATFAQRHRRGARHCARSSIPTMCAWKVRRQIRPWKRARSLLPWDQARRIDKVPVNGKTIINSDQILGLETLPEVADRGGRRRDRRGIHLHVRGAGVRVTLIEKRNRLLEFADQEIIEALSYHLRDSRVTMRLGEEVESVEEPTPGTVVANLESKKKVSGDALLYAVGRQGNVDDLNLAAAGLEADKRGRIAVDEHYQTKVAHIYAVGDVVGFPSLASVSMEQGRIAAARAFDDHAATSNPSFYPYGIYTIPEISFIGKTEEQLTGEDVPYEVGMAYYREVARGTDSRRHDGPAEADFSSRHAEGAGRAHYRRRSQRTGAHRPGGDDAGRHGGLLHRYGVQLPDARGVLQSGGVQWAGEIVAVPGGVSKAADSYQLSAVSFVLRSEDHPVAGRACG